MGGGNTRADDDHEGITVQTNEDELRAILAEAESTTETADKLANGDYPQDADHTRVLAGLIKQTSEQVERLARSLMDSGSGDGSGTSDRPS